MFMYGTRIQTSQFQQLTDFDPIHRLTGKPFTFDPDGEDNEQIARMLEESKHDLIKNRKLISLLSTFKDIFDYEARTGNDS